MNEELKHVIRCRRCFIKTIRQHKLAHGQKIKLYHLEHFCGQPGYAKHIVVSELDLPRQKPYYRWMDNSSAQFLFERTIEMVEDTDMPEKCWRVTGYVPGRRENTYWLPWRFKNLHHLVQKCENVFILNEEQGHVKHIGCCDDPSTFTWSGIRKLYNWPNQEKALELMSHPEVFMSSDDQRMSLQIDGEPYVLPVDLLGTFHALHCDKVFIDDDGIAHHMCSANMATHHPSFRGTSQTTLLDIPPRFHQSKWYNNKQAKDQIMRQTLELHSIHNSYAVFLNDEVKQSLQQRKVFLPKSYAEFYNTINCLKVFITDRDNGVIKHLCACGDSDYHSIPSGSSGSSWKVPQWFLETREQDWLDERDAKSMVKQTLVSSTGGTRAFISRSGADHKRWSEIVSNKKYYYIPFEYLSPLLRRRAPMWYMINHIIINGVQRYARAYDLACEDTFVQVPVEKYIVNGKVHPRFKDMVYIVNHWNDAEDLEESSPSHQTKIVIKYTGRYAKVFYTDTQDQAYKIHATEYIQDGKILQDVENILDLVVDSRQDKQAHEEKEEDISDTNAEDVDIEMKPIRNTRNYKRLCDPQSFKPRRKRLKRKSK